MDRTKILNKVRQTLFFRSLTEDSQKKLASAWPGLTQEQVMKVMALACYEKLLGNFIKEEAPSLITELKKNKKHE